MDGEHLAGIRRAPSTFAPGGLVHLVLEVLAYAAEEAASLGGGTCTVSVHPDRSVSVADAGRGTEVREHEAKKPIMSTKDLRFFDTPDAETLPDGHPRRGMSVVAALSEWLLHTNRRVEGAWTQRYEHGVPVSGLTSIPADGTTGTTVRFRVRDEWCTDDQLRAVAGLPLDAWSELTIEYQR